MLLCGGDITNSDLVWRHATKELIGSLNIGLVGLLAELMSIAACHMINVSGLIVNNLYKRIVKNQSET